MTPDDAIIRKKRPNANGAVHVCAAGRGGPKSEMKRNIRILTLAVLLPLPLATNGMAADDAAQPAPVRDLSALDAQLQAVATASDCVAVSQLGQVRYGDFAAPIWRVTFAPQRPARHRVLLTGGVHGDEPAGTAALLRFITGLGDAPDRYPAIAFDIVPLVNPWGWVNDKRRNGQNLDINRDFGSFAAQEAAIMRDAIRGKVYDLIVDLHEDDSAAGFYLYQIANADDALSRRVIARQRSAGHPIEQNVRMIIFKTRDGVIRIPRWGLPLARIARQLSMTNYFRLVKQPQVYLLETPSRRPLAERVAMHLAALEVLLEDLR